MSMIGEYLRVGSGELHRAMADPDWALELAEEHQDLQEDGERVPGRDKHFSTYKAWALLQFLLERRGFPVDLVMGEEEFAGDEDWGYGPPRYLTAARVREAADALAGLTYGELLHGVEPALLDAAQVYPVPWESLDSLQWGRHWFEGLSVFVTAAADAGDALLVWID